MPDEVAREKASTKRPKIEMVDIFHDDPIPKKLGLPPADYLLQIKSFALLAENVEEMYESGSFEAGGYKWRLVLFPNGNNEDGGSGFISLYLDIAAESTKSLPANWEINVSLKMFVLDQKRDSFLTVEDKTCRRYYSMGRRWGFDQLISLEAFNGPSNGYLVDDCCVFGVKVVVHERSGKGECFSMVKQPRNKPIVFKVENFSKLDDKCCHSDVYTVEGFEWRLDVHPKGINSGAGRALSVFLRLVNAANVLSDHRKLFAEYKLRVRTQSQIHSKHRELTAKRWFSSSSTAWGFPEFLELADLHNTSNRYIVKDAVIVEAEIMIMSNHKCF